MTLVANSRWLADHQHTAIGGSLLDRLVRVAPSLSPDYRLRVAPTLKVVEAYLQLTQQTLSEELLADTERAKSICEGFIGAAHSSRFQAPSIRRAFRQSSIFLSALRGLHIVDPSALPFHHLSQYKVTSEVAAWVRQFENTKIDEHATWLWSGWLARNKTGIQVGLPLYSVYKRLGREFTQRLFEAGHNSIHGSSYAHIECFRPFCNFLGNLPPEFEASQFSDPYFVDDFFVQFIRYYFNNTKTHNMKISAQIEHWNYGFTHFAKNYLFGHVMATPARPMPTASRRKTTTPRLAIASDGVAFTKSLLTHIPLQVSDSVARELLFNHIQHDFDAVVQWARTEVNSLWAAHKNRITLAANGSVRYLYSKGCGRERSPSLGLTDLANPEWLSNAAATYQAHGHFGPEAHAEKIFPTPLVATSEALGLPVDGALLPHAALLVAAHPIITTAFLERLQLFDRRGRQVGFVELDGGWYLVGQKPRRGPRNAQQEVLLNDSTKQLVDQIIDLTSNLREFLKARNNPAWRLLFLTAKSLAATPHIQRFSAQATRNIDQLSIRFSQALNICQADGKDLASRFSLRALRASAGVLIYIRTQSVVAMAKALGHKTYSPQLLDRYLPRPIRAFFLERWIRIFQSALICESLKESDYLLEASPFNNMDELDSFLSLHALKSIPAHIADPEGTGAGDGSEDESRCQVIFGISNGIMTALLSLELAVNEAAMRPSGRAIYWAAISHRLSEFLAWYDERPDLQRCLKWAQENASAGTFRKLIYE